ncbi:hypothetical protein EG68_06388 [Paragonimus skrjabini miyazakii]|uniref:Neurofascin/L1/NrCAM C-terminal domain-containing protein n=1 Tax=Paragonimus skrjabini miyazakii TaxID=59628 RepID=A0A8S9YDN1_9TREM|nr:hypothetical protein EG68_06388 [Paragonimus skrjabini miyazakii]
MVLRCIAAAVLLILLVLPFGFFQQSLNFVPVRNAHQGPVVYITNTNPIAVLDASSPASRIVYFAKRSSYMEQFLIFYCRVNTQSAVLRSISLCCRKDRSASERQCYRISDTQPTGKLSCLRTNFDYTYDGHVGANFSIRIEKMQDLSYPIAGLFSCSVTDSLQTTITSSELEVRDVVYYIRQLPVKPSNIITSLKPISKSAFPFAFECASGFSSKDWPTWMHTLNNNLGIYQWGFCKDCVSQNAMSCMERRIPLPSDISLSFLNGTMYLLDPSFLGKGDRAIMCKSDENEAPVNTFAGDFQESPVPVIKSGLSLDTTSQGNQHLVPLTELTQRYVIVDRSPLGGFALRALYREPEGGTHFQWQKDGLALPTKGASKFSYQLPLVADTKLEGSYELTVTSDVQPEDKLVFTFDIEIVYGPIFTDLSCLSRLFYVMKGANFSTICPFDSKATSRCLVGVNQHEASTPADLRRVLAGEASLNRKLSELDIDFSFQENTNKKEIQVSINSMQTGQDFELAMRLESPYGDSHIYSSLKVIPIPKLITSPQSSNCAEDCDSKPFNVSCVLDPVLVQQWKQQYEISPTVSWVIHSQWLSEQLDPDGIGQFISVSTADGTILSVWPQGNPESQPFKDQTTKAEEEQDSLATSGSRPNSLKEYIAENSGSGGPRHPEDLVLRCRIRLMVHTNEAEFVPPPGLHLRRLTRQHAGSLLSASSSEPRLMYDSSWETDTNLVSQLIATRAFTPEPVPAAASLAWIAAVVIGVIIVIVVIALSVWLYTRDRGETYKLYEKERAHGNDPIQEMKETEGFKTYERQEEQPIASSRYSLNDESMHVGSEDDGELDEYEANFNEEGSFINGYTTDSAIPRRTFDQISPPGVAVVSSTISRHAGQNHTAV